MRLGNGGERLIDRGSTRLPLDHHLVTPPPTHRTTNGHQLITNKIKPHSNRSRINPPHRQTRQKSQPSLFNPQSLP